MAYSLEQVGTTCQCPSCDAHFMVPGGTKDAIQDALRCEQQIAEAKEQTHEELPDFAVDNRLLVEQELARADSELEQQRKDDRRVFGFTPWTWGAALVVLLVGTGFFLLWRTDRVDLSGIWPPSQDIEIVEPNSSPNAPRKPTLAPTPKPTNKELGPTKPQPTTTRIEPAVFRAIPPVAQPVSIGPKERAEVPHIPAGIHVPFEPKPVTKKEVTELTNHLVAAIQNNSSKDWLQIMDEEVMGNYLFPHVTDPKERYVLGYDSYQFIKSNSAVASGNDVDCQMLGCKKMGEAVVGFIRVSSLMRLQTPSPTRSPASSGSNLFPAMTSVVQEFQKDLKVYRSSLPTTSPITGQTGISSVRQLLDHSMGFYAVIATRSRYELPVLLDVYCLNAPDCLFDQTWSAIQKDATPKSFEAKRPEFKSNSYQAQMAKLLGNKAIENLAIANVALEKCQFPKSASSSASTPLHPASGTPSDEQCIDALEDLARDFPDDSFNLMLQAILTNPAADEGRAKSLRWKVMEAGCSCEHFYEQIMSDYTSTNKVEEAREILGYFRQNMR